MTDSSETGPAPFEADHPDFQAMLYETRREFAVFDGLPAAVRAALRESEFTWFGVHEVRKLLDSGISEGDMVSGIKRSDHAIRDEIQRQRQRGILIVR